MPAISPHPLTPLDKETCVRCTTRHQGGKRYRGASLSQVSLKLSSSLFSTRAPPTRKKQPPNPARRMTAPIASEYCLEGLVSLQQTSILYIETDSEKKAEFGLANKSFQLVGRCFVCITNTSQCTPFCSLSSSTLYVSPSHSVIDQKNCCTCRWSSPVQSQCKMKK